MIELEKKSIEKIKKVFVKSSNIFKKKAILTYDGYIVDINADLSNESYLGVYILKIDDDVNELMHQLFEKEYLVIEIVPSKTKTDFSIHRILEDNGRSSYYKMIDKVNDLIAMYNIYINIDDSKWKLLADVIDYNEVFVDNKAVEIPHTEIYSGDVTISKTILPNVTKSIFNKVKYRTEKYTDMLNTLTINIHVDGTDIIMHYYYL